MSIIIFDQQYDINTESLDFSEKGIRYIPKEIKLFKNLKELYFGEMMTDSDITFGNRIEEIYEDTFEGMTSLEILSLNNCNIKKFIKMHLSH